MVTKEVTVIAPGGEVVAINAMKPSLVLEHAREAAKALMEVVSQKAKPVIMNGEQYLEYEDWQTVGQFYRYAVKTGDAVPVEVNGIQGAKAKAELLNMDTGEVLGSAEAYCLRDEEKWNTRPKYEWQDDNQTGERKKVKVGDELVPWFQLASMAQTRAGAKAYRNRLAWVVVLAGYRPTPAEELTDHTIQSREETHQRGHWCKVHKTVFFKKGKMKTYAHPTGEGLPWCEELEPTTVRAGATPSAGTGPGAEPPSHSPAEAAIPPPGTLSQPGQPPTGTSDESLSSANANTPMPTPSTTAEAAPAEGPDPDKMPGIARWGDFWTILWSDYKVSQSNFLKAVGKSSQSEFGSYDEAWRAFCAWWKGQTK